MLSPLSAYSFFPARAACQKRAAFATYRRIGGLIAIIPKDWKYLRGDIYYADLRPVVGSEQGGIRPVVILQNNVGNRYSPTVIAAPITSRRKTNLPTHVSINRQVDKLRCNSVILMEQIRTIDKSRLMDRIGVLNDYEMQQVNQALGISVGLV